MNWQTIHCKYNKSNQTRLMLFVKDVDAKVKRQITMFNA